MKAYRLKDKERQKTLELALPRFAEELNRACEDQVDDKTALVHVMHIPDYSSEGGAWTITFKKDEIESCPAYDPNNWNNYPEVEPPVGLTMRLEVFPPGSGGRRGLRYAAQFLGGKWHKYGSRQPITTNEGDTVRFRPWEDERHIERPEEQRKLGLLSQYLINSDPNGRN